MFTNEEINNFKNPVEFLINWNANQTVGTTPLKWVYFNYSHVDGKLIMVIGVVGVRIADSIDFNSAAHIAKNTFCDFVREMVGLPPSSQQFHNTKIIK